MSFHAYKSPSELARAAGVQLPSFAIETILDAVYALPPTDEQLAVLRQVAPKRAYVFPPAWPTTIAKRVVAMLGRRGLKTTGILVWMLLYELLCVASHEEHAALGSRVYFVIVAPRQAQAREAVHAIRAGLDSLAHEGVKYTLRDLAGTPEIVINDPVSKVEKVITIMTADAVAVRGFAIAFAAFDEAAFLNSNEWNAMTDKDVLRALAPAMVQFPDAKMLFVSSPGAPQGLFHEYVTRPPRGTVVFRAPTWVTNHRITEEQCRVIAGDEETFAQEFAVSRFGYQNESFIDSAAALACIDHENAFTTTMTGRALSGSAVVAVDTASTGDDAAFAVGYSLSRPISPHTAPIRECVIESVQTWEASRERPITIEQIAEHAAALSALKGGCPIIADNRGFTDIAAYLARRHGFKIIQTTDDAERLKAIARGGRVVVERPMAPQFQTPRWRNLRDMVVGKRLHLPNTPEGEKAARQIGQLRASTMSSGWLKVEGRKDDAADVVALLCEATAVRRNARWVREYPDGRRVAGGHIEAGHSDFFWVMREALADGRSEPHFDEELARLLHKNPAQLTVDDRAWFLNESGLGISTDHMVSLDEVAEPTNEPAWLTIANRRLPRV
jgi:hypothetical protein